MIDTHLQEYQDYLLIQRGFSPNTVKAYLFDLNSFFSYLALSSPPTLTSVTKQAIRGYLASLSITKGNKPANMIVTRARKLASIRSFCGYLTKEKIVATDPSLELDVPHIPEKEPCYLTRPEYKRLLRVVQNKGKSSVVTRDYALIGLLLSTGIRVSELTGLTLPNLDLMTKTIKVTRKGNREQTIPICDWVAQAIANYLPIRRVNSSSLFTTRTGRPFGTRSVYYVVSKYLKLARITKDKSGAHLLRHTCLTNLIAKNVNPAVVQAIAGHRSFDTTKRYIHISDQQLRMAIAKI